MERLNAMLRAQIPCVGALLVLDSDGRRITGKVLPRPPPAARRPQPARSPVGARPVAHRDASADPALPSPQYAGERYETAEQQAEFERTLFAKTRGNQARTEGALPRPRLSRRGDARGCGSDSLTEPFCCAQRTSSC